MNHTLKQAVGRSLVGGAVAIATLGVSADATASPIYSVAFNDPAGLYSSYYAPLASHALAAGNAWGEHLSGNGALDVEISFSSLIPRATGRSLTSSFVGTDGPLNVFDQGAAGELRTGVDPNGPLPDIEFVFNPVYLANILWFDPDPLSRVAPVPADRTDAMSVLLHEYGHAFAFNGWRDSFTGTLPENYESPFDALTVFNGTDFFFLGSIAQTVYGGPVPLTFGNYGHVGNAFPRPGSDLIPDLMNGVVFFNGTRYGITPLDLAVFADTGIELQETDAVPEPGTLTLLAIGSVGIAIRRRYANRTKKR